MVSVKVPHEIIALMTTLKNAGFEAYVVGGCVRDALLGIVPHDWDVTTNATPDRVQELFPEHVYENAFGTVGVKTGSDDPTCAIVEVTTYRVEQGYSDARHPDSVFFARTVSEDLARRDFTVNAIALAVDDNGSVIEIIDPFGGQGDNTKKIIRAVGDARTRFGEDALRMMRAVRLSAQLDFTIDIDTQRAISDQAHLLKRISKERVRDEFIKIIMTPRAAWGVQLLESFGLLTFIAPGLREGIGVTQNLHHIYTVWEHNLRTLDYAATKGFSLPIRLAALFHDAGKPRSKHGEGEYSTFYSHEMVSTRIIRDTLRDLKFPSDIERDATHLVRYHMFNYAVGDVSPAGVRRLVARVGERYIDDLIKLREADRIGSGVPKAMPYKLRHLLFMIEKVKNDPISPKKLVINGTQIMDMLTLYPSPRVGHILNALLEEVIDDPTRNEYGYLSTRARELNMLSDQELEKLHIKAQQAKEAFDAVAEEEIKKKHKV